MTLTNGQYKWLRWLARNGGKGVLHGQFITANGERSNTTSAIAFLHLVAKDIVEFRDGFLVITDYGHRHLEPTP